MNYFFLFSIADRLRDALGEVGFQLNSAILSVLMMRYIRKDGTLRFGDFVAIILNLSIAFGKFFKEKTNFKYTRKYLLRGYVPSPSGMAKEDNVVERILVCQDPKKSQAGDAQRRLS